MDPSSLELLPLPRRRVSTPERFELAPEIQIELAHESPATERLVEALANHGTRASFGAEGSIRLTTDVRAVPAAEGYSLSIGRAGIRIVGSDDAGLFYGIQTLVQLIRSVAHGSRQLSGVRIDDAPSFPNRGFMLDVSRDRIPTMQTLLGWVDLFAGWKINQLQLYMEHTFAYADHAQVWHDASPFTPEEIRTLDRYCRARHIQLVPNQQSLGHMHRWLALDSYRALAECPDGVVHPFSHRREPYGLCAVDPASLAFMSERFDELLPCFESSIVNVGCDETFDLGRGRSAAACRERGTGRVYLEYVTALAHDLAERGKHMQFWADIVLHYPELVSELPEGVTPMLWGYERDHPFERETRCLQASGLPFYVCPGTSSWLSIAGRFSNMAANIESATRHGIAAGAVGVLVTDWGDRGHLQPETASYAGWIIGADLAWNADAPAERRSPNGAATMLARHAFVGAPAAVAERAGRIAIDLASLSESIGARVSNSSVLSIVLTKIDEAFPPDEVEGLTVEGLERAGSTLARITRELTESPFPADGKLAQLEWSARMLEFAQRLALERLGSVVDGDLGAELDALIEEYRELWFAHSRPGGFERSVEWLTRVAATLR